MGFFANLNPFGNTGGAAKNKDVKRSAPVKPSGKSAPVAVKRPVAGALPKASPVDAKKVVALASAKDIDSRQFNDTVTVRPRYQSLEDIPAHSLVLTGDLSNPNSVIGIAPKFFGQIAAVQTGKSEAAIIVAEVSYGNNVYQQVRAELIKKHFRIGVCGIADTGLIQMLYSSSDNNNQVAAKESEMAKALDAMIEAALDKDASDIHLEKRDVRATVRMRIDGRLRHISDWTPPYFMAFGRALHTLADSDSKETMFSETDSQQMSVSRALENGRKVKLRVQTVPAYPDGGMDIIMRVLKVGAVGKIVPLPNLGYERHHVRMLEQMMSSPAGMIVIAGTTGSGKSTTLQTMMSNIHTKSPNLKLYSVEDPPEYIIKGVTQIPVPRRRSDNGGFNPFAKTMRDVMRADPDIVMVGEVRDPESAECLISMVNSGHKVLTTTHSSSAFDTVGRFEKFGIDRMTQAGLNFISGLIYQTLVPKLCPHCKVAYHRGVTLDDQELHDRIALIQHPGDTIFVQGEGCDKCDKSGIIGRTVVAEMVIPDQYMRALIAEGNVALAFQQWRGSRQISDSLSDVSMSGMRALDHGILKVRRGEISPVNAEDCLGRLVDNDESSENSSEI